MYLEDKIKSFHYCGIEKLNKVEEYNFYIIKIIGKTLNNEMQQILFRIIRKGQIRESLFCICALECEHYFIGDSNKQNKVIKKISIVEENINKVSVNLYTNSNSKKNLKIKVDINFIKMSKFMNNEEKKEIDIKGWEKFSKLFEGKILVIGTKKIY